MSKQGREQHRLDESRAFPRLARPGFVRLDDIHGLCPFVVSEFCDRGSVHYPRCRSSARHFHASSLDRHLPPTASGAYPTRQPCGRATG